MSLQLIENGLNNSELLKIQLGSNHNKYVISVLNEIKKTANDDKKSLVNCTPDSIISAIKQACDLQLEIDGRQHCHLVKYGNNATLQVGYRGFIYAIKRAYPDANIDCKLVRKGDLFTVKSEGDTTTYSLEIKDPFADKAEIIGGYCHISYTIGGRLVSFCETMSLAEINKIKGKAKQDFIWKEWFEEKAKVAIIRRACKIHFSGIQQIEQITEFDNKEQLAVYLQLKYGAFTPYKILHLMDYSPQKNIEPWVTGPIQQWLRTLPFDKIDSVSLFYNDHYCPLKYHRDYNFLPYEKGNQLQPDTLQDLIWFRFDLSREFFLYDINADGSVKHSVAVEGHTATFNHYNWHGNISAYDKASLTVKVEGKFIEGFNYV